MQRTHLLATTSTGAQVIYDAGHLIDDDGNMFMEDARGALVPMRAIKPTDKLMDETVRKVIAFAEFEAQQVQRFYEHTMTDVESFLDLIAQEYGTTMGGRKGNITLTSFDGMMKVQLQVQDRFEFGPELQAAKQLIDECLNEWSAGSSDKLKAVITRAFQVDKQGNVNRSEIMMLLRIEIEDARWKSAMQALRDSMRIIGSKSYLRFYKRDAPDSQWHPIVIDIANAGKLT